MKLPNVQNSRISQKNYPIFGGKDPFAAAGIRPELALDFEQQRFRQGANTTAPNAYTATRTGLATQLDASGNLVWNAHNLALNSATPATQNITVVSGADYTVECTGSGSITLSGAGTGSVTEGNPVEITASTTTLTLTVVGSLDTMWAYRSDLGGMAPVPLTRRVAGSTTYVPTTSAAVYLPREEAYTYVSGSLVGPYYQKESDARTNLETNSVSLSGYVSNALNSTVTVGQDDPFGGAGAGLYQATSLGLAYSFGVTYSDASTKTLSFWLKAGTTSQARIQIGSGAATSGVYADVDLSNGTIGAATLKAGAFTPIQSTIENYGNGWYRASVTVTTPATLHFAYVTFPTTPTGGENYLIYGAQLEAGSTPTSYIPTSGFTVPRSADSTTISAGNMPHPTPQVIGPELVTNGTFDTDTDWTNLNNGSLAISGNQAVLTAPSQFDGFYGVLPTISLKLVQVSVDVVSVSGGPFTFNLKSSSNGTGAGTYSTTFSASDAGSTVSFIAYTSTSINSITIQSKDTDASSLIIDNISVREINPLALSFQMDGLVTGESSTFADWTLDANNGIQITSGASDFTFTQEAAGVVDSVTGGSYTSGVNTPFNFASTHASTLVAAAVDGTSLTPDTTPTTLPDLSATTFDLAPTFNGFIKEFRVWADDIGDTGIAEAST